MDFGDWVGKAQLDEDLSGKLCKAGRNRVVISHAVGASNDGRYALLKVALFGGDIEFYAVPTALTYWLIDRIAEAVAAGAIKDLRSTAAAGSPEAQQIALHGAARPEISDADWELASRRIVGEIRAHAFGNALGLMTITEGIEMLLVLPDQVAILLHDSLTLVATYLIDQAHPPVSLRQH
jgi:hypothetical protein